MTASRSAPCASALTRASASALLPARKLSKPGSGGGEISSGSCRMSLPTRAFSACLARICPSFPIQGTCDVSGAKMAQPHEHGGARRQREQHPEKPEHLAEGEQGEDHRDRMQADAVADD